MRQRRLAAIAAAGAAAIALVPAGAASADPVPDTLGGGPVVGTISPCVDGQLTVTYESAAFVFNGERGTAHGGGSAPCQFVDEVSGSSFGGSYELTGPGFTCTLMGGAWVYVTPWLNFTMAGPCTMADNTTRTMSFAIEAAISPPADGNEGTFAGALVVGWS